MAEVRDDPVRVPLRLWVAAGLVVVLLGGALAFWWYGGPGPVGRAVAEAQQLLGRGYPLLAIDRLRRLGRPEDLEPQALVLLAEAHCRNGDHHAALAVCDLVVSRQSPDPALQYWRGQSLFGLGRASDAEGQWKECFEGPMARPARRALANLYSLQGRFEEAGAVIWDLYEQGIPPAAIDPALQFSAAEGDRVVLPNLLLEQLALELAGWDPRQSERIVAQLEEFHKAAPEDFEARLAYARALAALANSPDRSRDLLVQNVKDRPDHAGAAEEFLLSELKHQDPSAYRDWLREHADDFPTHAGLWELRGRAYEKDEDISKATAAFTRALAIDPRRIEVRRGLGRLLDRQGKAEEAASHRQKAESLEKARQTILERVREANEEGLSARICLDLAEKTHEIGRTEMARAWLRFAEAFAADRDSIERIRRALEEGPPDRTEAPTVGAVSGATRQPNILFFFADDQRFDTLGCAGHPIIRTPHIDRLASQGVRFTNMFVTTSICWVSRAVVLTGQLARSHSEPDDMPRVQRQALAGMYPLRLREGGYRTAFFGKWHLHGPGGLKPAEFFDEFEAIGRNPYLKPQPDGTTRHEAQLIADRAIAFLSRQDHSQPFCLNLWFNTAHAEDGDRRPGHHYQWPATVDGMYEEVAIPAPRLSDPRIFESHPEFLKQSLNRQRFFWGYDTPDKYQTNVRAYFRMISGLDHEIGRVLKALEDRGLAADTIVVYSADNGYYLGDRGFQGKWSHYEESLRVPLVVYDPRLPEPQRGRVARRPLAGRRQARQMVLNVDLPATFLDWAGLELPQSYQGQSLAPLVRGESPPWRSEFFCEHLDLSPHLVWEGVRGERFVYARYVHQQPVYEFLHDLQSDPDELTNLAGDASSAGTLEKMRQRCGEYVARYGPPIPSPRRNAPRVK